MSLKIYQVDAFTNEVFRGNPAAVIPLKEGWLDEKLMQNIAMENNLSETAFFYPDYEAYLIRWLTPETEVDLCGHATLATAAVIFEKLNHPSDVIRFKSRSGDLFVKRTDQGYQLDFPVWDFTPAADDPDLAEAMGADPLELYHGHDWVAVFDSESTVRNLKPDMVLLQKLPTRGVIATAKSDDPDVDFVSRFFGPAVGIPEDPVTGSAHCILGPIWAKKLNKKKFSAQQVSQRSGQLYCELQNDRILISGQAVFYMEGIINVT